MALAYLLDGYNIMMSAAGPFSSGTLERRRRALLDHLLDLRPQGSAQNTLTVVFDGKLGDPFWSSVAAEEHYHGIRVRYTEGRTADGVIEEMVVAAERPAEVVVVTNDKGIRRRIGGTGARCIGVDEFLGRGKGQRHAAPDAGEPAAGEDVTDELRRKWLR